MTSDAPRIPGVDGVCGALTGPHTPRTRLFHSGWWCDLHTPAAQAGRDETPPGPGWPIHRQPPPDTESEAAAPTSTTEHKERQ
ncbi:hypothetical protein [Streptomyces sp. NBC_00582]|uniref:hypothetical protein n=1 Tax=Streptomyces sp. NBC_00582 TaxID=2975783 RepID=UPI002E807F41|nr:hypothetical protein [Streptomyces sp. NBC_00582]WUB64468.1 hypothetical protein OG852_30770 [Streptomyces sp. NBC_00582]